MHERGWLASHRQSILKPRVSFCSPAAPAAGMVTCEQGLLIQNTGTLQLFNVTASGNANCTLALVEPDATVFCKVGLYTEAASYSYQPCCSRVSFCQSAHSLHIAHSHLPALTDPATTALLSAHLGKLSFVNDAAF